MSQFSTALHPVTLLGRPLYFRPAMLVTAELDETSLETLRSMADVRYRPYRQTLQVLTGRDLVEAAADCHVIVTEVDLVDLEVLTQLPKLKLVLSCRGNPVNVDVAACTALGIPVLHTPGRNADSVAELTVAFMLMLARKLPEASRFLHAPGGEAGDLARLGAAHFRLKGCELAGKTAGLIGLGAVGKAVAKRLHSIGMKVLGFDPYLPCEEIMLADAEPAAMDELLGGSDFVSLHAAGVNGRPLLLGADEFDRMKDGVFFINTARAGLVDEEALARALRSGKLAGAAIDVFSVEPPGDDHPLVSLPNVIATPHIGGNTGEVAGHQGRFLVEDMARLLRGAWPERILNPETLPRFFWSGAGRELPEEVLERLKKNPLPAVSDQQQVRQEGLCQSVETRSGNVEPPEGKRFRGLTGLRDFVSPLGVKRRARPEAVATEPPPEEGAASGMEKTVRAFLRLALNDPALQSFASDHRVSVQYHLQDMGLSFYLSFRDGAVAGGVGLPQEPAEVQLKMKAEVLDGILTGRLSGVNAAMTGRLSFSGDTRLAMTLQRIARDLGRLYGLAREETGGQVDLPVDPRPSPAPTRSVAPVAAGDVRQEILRVVNDLYAAGFVSATAGNVSARSTGTGEVWITPSGQLKEDVRIESLVRLSLDGGVLDAEACTPSSERFMHCAIYRARPDVSAVIHAHAPQSNLLGLAGLPFLPISVEAACVKDLPRVPFLMPGSQELARAVCSALGRGQAVLLVNHGLVVASDNLRSALNLVHVIERTAQDIVTCYAVGRQPQALPEEVVSQLGDLGPAIT